MGMDFQYVLQIVDYMGIIAFSISGAMVAIEEEVDFFGVLFLGLITALGGGTLRDTFLGTLPPSNFFHYSGITLALVTAAIVFFIACMKRSCYFSHTEKVENINNIADAIGLGLFSVYGVQATWNAGFTNNVFLSVFMGMLTGVGGGLMRDVIVKKKPVIITKHIYAVAAIAGSLCYCSMVDIGFGETPSVIMSVLAVFTIRMISAKYRINLPKVHKPA